MGLRDSLLKSRHFTISSTIFNTLLSKYIVYPEAMTFKFTLDFYINFLDQAFKMQKSYIRDYRPYFKPVLCYLEGAWTHAGETVEEPFVSERHSIDARTWDELIEKVHAQTSNHRELGIVLAKMRPVWYMF